MVAGLQLLDSLPALIGGLEDSQCCQTREDTFVYTMVSGVLAEVECLEFLIPHF